MYSIGYFAFSGTAIKTIMIPGGPGISLGNIFGNCTSLQTIILDKSTTRISFLTNNHSDDTISLIAFGGSASSYSFYFKGDIYILSGRIDDGISKIYTTSEIDNTITIDIADYIESVDGLQTSIQWFRNGQECGDSYTLTLDKPGIYNATLTFSFYGQEITVDAVNKTVSDDNSISIKFMVDDAEYSEYYISSGEKIVAPADPSKTGYVFSGWYIEGGSQPFDFDQPIAANTVLTAHWEPISYTVSFDSNGGDGTMQSLVIDYGETKELETSGF